MIVVDWFWSVFGAPPGATDHLRVTLTLPSGAPNTLQNQSSTITYAFTGTQRTATSK